MKYSIAAGVVIIVCLGAWNISRWIDCNDQGGRFMMNMWRQYECIK